MAIKTKKKSPKKPVKKKSGKKEIYIKNEIFGLLLIGAGLLVGLALISYHQSDPVGSLEPGNIYHIKNWLGVAGSTIAAPLFQWTIGYPILVLPLLITMLGFCLLLHIPVKKIVKFSVIISLWSLFFGIILAMPQSLKSFGEVNSFYPGGFLGGITASFLVKLLSKFGAIFVLLIFLGILVMLSFKFRISSLAFHFAKFVSSMLQTISHFFLQLKSGLSTRKKRKKIRSRISPESLVQGQKESFIEPEDPFYQPSLPSEKEGIKISDDQEIEIVHHDRDGKTSEIESVESSDRKAQNAAMAGVKNKSADEEKSIKPGDLGFEVQEAHQEKELDYDSLVRDSLSKYQFPSTDLLLDDSEGQKHLSEFELKNNAHLLENTLAQFGVRVTVNRVIEGPVITLYEVKPAQGVKISKIVTLADDLALAMRAKGIRMIAPIPGKAAIGIEIPNRRPSIVYFKSIVRSETYINYQGNLILGMGKTISGEVYCTDLTKMPHLLIAGATGSGKSVGINTMIASLLYRIPPSDLKFVMIDPKKLELSIFAKLKDHYLAIAPELDEIVITHPQNAILILRSVVNEMEERYDKLASMGVREINHYNRKIEEYQRNGDVSDEHRRLPYLVVVIDELADLILSATREVEEPITRLAQMARAVGIHLIMATQRPSVDILTGLIKANFPARVAFQVATRPDSKVILDMYGAEKLIGNGDMLFFPPGKVKPIRLQNPLITTEEVERIIRHVRRQPKFPPYKLKLVRAKTKKGPGAASMFEVDKLFEEAKKIVIHFDQGSVSLLQRKLKIGYARAARIMDQLEEAGIVGPQVQDGKARAVLLSGQSPDLD